MKPCPHVLDHAGDAMPRLAAIIFDVDGTLAETEELHRHAFNAAFAAAGLPWHWDQPLYAHLLAVAGGKERIAHFIETTPGAAGLDAGAIARLHADKTHRYADSVARGGLGLRPGVARLAHQAAARGIQRAIATTTSHANITALLAACAPLPAFDVIAAGDDVPAKKPAPDIYILALQRLALPASACVAIEDTPNGLNSAMGAGLRCVVTLSAYGGMGPFPGARCVLSHLGDAGTPATTILGPPPPEGIVTADYLSALPSTV
jgi:HAD superfamily hydrolase (TIGR01509 family)